MIEAKSVLSKALAVACPRCLASIGNPCTKPDGQLVAYKGHLGVHGARLFAARHIQKTSA